MSKMFGEIRQLGYVVKDIDSTIDYFINTLGIGPFLMLPNVEFSNFRYKGSASKAPKLTIALAHSGSTQIELIQQHDDSPSIYKDFLDQGKQGLQHYSSWDTTADLNAKISKLADEGHAVVQEGNIPEMGGQFAYYDTSEHPGGVMFEMANLKEPGLLELLDLLQTAAENWDGQTRTIEM